MGKKRKGLMPQNIAFVVQMELKRVKTEGLSPQLHQSCTMQKPQPDSQRPKAKREEAKVQITQCVT